MAQILVRNLEESVKAKLAARAKTHGRSTEEEVREILRAAVKSGTPPEKLGAKIASYFKGIGLESPIEELRGYPARPADLGRAAGGRRRRKIAKRQAEPL